jgi:hypothetical protein
MTTQLVLEAIASVRGIQAIELAKSRKGGALYQGAAPPYGSALRDAGFTVLVLSASEFQPDASRFPGVQVLRCALDDGPIDQRMWQAASTTARAVARFVRQGERALVTCGFGLNRSSLVSAMTLHELEGLSGPAAVARIQKRQGHGWALYNQSFREAIEAIRGRR